MSADSSQDLSRLYRAASQEEAPAWLDDKINLAAAEAVGRARQRRFTTSPRWRLPAAWAAVLVLSTSVAWLMHSESEDQPKRYSGTLESKKGNTATAQSPAAPPHDYKAPRLPMPSLQPPTPPAEPTRDTLIQPHRSTQHSGNGQIAERKQPSISPEELHAAETALAREASSSASSASPPRVPMSDAQNAESDARKRAAKAVGGIGPKQEAPARADLARATGESEDPAQWLSEIEQLMREGRDAEAHASLEAFRRRFPTYRIPDGLQ